jgi:hypothetical protein
MQPKEISRLKRQMQKVCNAGINGIIEQLIFHEDEHKVKQGDPYAAFKAVDLKITFIMNVEDKDKKVPSFQMASSHQIDFK